MKRGAPQVQELQGHGVGHDRAAVAAGARQAARELPRQGLDCPSHCASRVGISLRFLWRLSMDVHFTLSPRACTARAAVERGSSGVLSRPIERFLKNYFFMIGDVRLT
jgi:hypothetical protein